MIITNEFITQHDRLVRVIVNQFKVANVDPEDLMQEGRIGLIEAAKRFDPNRGIRFASYASWWIRREIERAIRQYGHCVSLPINAEDAYAPITEPLDKVLYVEEHEQITYADILTDGETVEADYIDTEHRRALRRECQQRIAKLKTKEQIVIRGLYGFEGKVQSLKSLAGQLKTSKDRIGKIHARALKRLKNI